ncbi:uncharacterized protein LOC142055597 [Phalacrocorax aristotelis]|uniref:uncharacterized protein LOC142055597 n=1 Tax=Phalacrocorax aristotelis TaxID=126867 RepID=UPI003F4BC1F0
MNSIQNWSAVKVVVPSKVKQQFYLEEMFLLIYQGPERGPPPTHTPTPRGAPQAEAGRAGGRRQRRREGSARPPPSSTKPRGKFNSRSGLREPRLGGRRSPGPATHPAAATSAPGPAAASPPRHLRRVPRPTTHARPPTAGEPAAPARAGEGAGTPPPTARGAGRRPPCRGGGSCGEWGLRICGAGGDVLARPPGERREVVGLVLHARTGRAPWHGRGPASEGRGCCRPARGGQPSVCQASAIHCAGRSLPLSEEQKIEFILPVRAGAKDKKRHSASVPNSGERACCLGRTAAPGPPLRPRRAALAAPTGSCPRALRFQPRIGGRNSRTANPSEDRAIHHAA